MTNRPFCILAGFAGSPHQKDAVFPLISTAAKRVAAAGKTLSWFVSKEENTQEAGSATRLDVPTSNTNSHYSKQSWTTVLNFFWVCFC